MDYADFIHKVACTESYGNVTGLDHKWVLKVWVFHFILGYIPLWGSGFDDKTYVEWKGFWTKFLDWNDIFLFVSGLDQSWNQNHQYVTTAYVYGHVYIDAGVCM